jgi:chromosome segregation ATPase
MNDEHRLLKEIRMAIKLFLAAESRRAAENSQDGDNATSSSSDLVSVDDNSEELDQFCMVVERVFRDGLKEKRSFFGGDKDYFDFAVNIVKLLPEARQCIQNVKSLSSARTSEGKGRAFIRIALVEKTLGKYIKRLAEEESLVRDWYNGDALMRNEEHVSMLVGVLEMLNVINFSLCLKDIDFDNLKTSATLLIADDSVGEAATRQLSELGEQLDARQATAEQLREELARIQKQLAAARADADARAEEHAEHVEALRSEVARVTDSADTAQRELDAVRAAAVLAEQQRRDTEQTLGEARAELAERDARIDELGEQARTADSDAATQRERADKLNVRLDEQAERYARQIKERDEQMISVGGELERLRVSVDTQHRDESAELRANVEHKSQAHATLLSEASELRQQLEALRHRLDTAEQRAEQLDAERTSALAELTAARAERVQAKQRVSELDAVLAERDLAIKRASHDSAQLQQKLGEASARHESTVGQFELRLATQREEFAGQLRERSTLQQTVDSQTKTLERRKCELADRQQRIDELQSQLAERDREIGAQRVKKDLLIDGKSKELAAKDDELGEKTDALQRKTDTLAEKEHLLAAKDDELAKKSNELSEKTKALSKKDQLLDEMTDELQRKTDALSEKTKALSKKDQLLDEKTEELQQKADELSKKETLLAETADQLTEKTDQLRQEGDEQLKRLASELDEFKDKLAVRDETLGEVRELLALVKGQLETERTAHAETETLLEAARLSSSRAEDELAEQSAEVTKLRAERDQLMRDVSEGRASLKQAAEAEASRVTLSHRVDELGASKRALNETVESLEAELATARGRASAADKLQKRVDELDAELRQERERTASNAELRDELQRLNGELATTRQQSEAALKQAEADIVTASELFKASDAKSKRALKRLATTVHTLTRELKGAKSQASGHSAQRDAELQRMADELHTAEQHNAVLRKHLAAATDENAKLVEQVETLSLVQLQMKRQVEEATDAKDELALRTRHLQRRMGSSSSVANLDSSSSSSLADAGAGNATGASVEPPDSMQSVGPWVPDEVVHSCHDCALPFGLLRRKHHCRRCGRVFCSDCSARTAIVAEIDPHNPLRVCDDCSIKLSLADH